MLTLPILALLSALATVAGAQSPAEQVNQVVDRLADRIGIAADAIKPTAEVIVAEVAMRHWVIAAGAGLVSAIALAAALICVVMARRCDAASFEALATIAFSTAIAAAVAFTIAVAQASVAVSPHLKALETVMGR